MEQEEHTVLETMLIKHSLHLYEVIARNNAKAHEEYQQARCAYVHLKSIFETENMENENEVIDGVNWKEVAHRYKAESHENLKDVQRLMAEKADLQMQLKIIENEVENELSATGSAEDCGTSV